jgi:branched-chain amino acid transport system substrate-binding protein
LETTTATGFQLSKNKTRSRSRLFRCLRGLRTPALVCVLLIVAPLQKVGAENAIRVAAIFSYTGAAASSNLTSILGVRWAIEDINRNGGVLGRQVRLIEIDNIGTPIGSKVAVDKAIREDAAAIIGPAWSTHALAAARTAQTAGIPMISNVATHPRVTRVGDCIFRVCNNDFLQGSVLGQFARRELEVERVVILQDLNSDYSLGLACTFREAFERLGGTICAVLDYKASQTNIKTLLATAKAVDPDLVFLPGHDESGSIVAEAHRMRLQVPFMGGDAWDVASFFIKGGNQLASGFYSTHWNEAVKNPQSIAFTKRYKKLYPFLSPAAHGYDAVLVLADAIRRSGSTDRRAICKALAQTKNFQGITGNLSFNASGDPIKPVIIMKITCGQPAFLKQVQTIQLPPIEAAGNGCD